MVSPLLGECCDLPSLYRLECNLTRSIQFLLALMKNRKMIIYVSKFYLTPNRGLEASRAWCSGGSVYISNSRLGEEKGRYPYFSSKAKLKDFFSRLSLIYKRKSRPPGFCTVRCSNFLRQRYFCAYIRQSYARDAMHRRIQ